MLGRDGSGSMRGSGKAPQTIMQRVVGGNVSPDDRKWVFNDVEVTFSPSRADDVPDKEEGDMRMSTVEFMGTLINACQGNSKLRGVLVPPTATLFQRFYALHSLTKFGRYHVAMAAIFLMSKHEDNPLTLNRIIRHGVSLLQRTRPKVHPGEPKLDLPRKTGELVARDGRLEPQYDPRDPRYIALRSELLELERRLLDMVAFDLRSSAPLAQAKIHLDKCRDAGYITDNQRTKLLQCVNKFASDSVHTTFCLKYTAAEIAKVLVLVTIFVLDIFDKGRGSAGTGICGLDGPVPVPFGFPTWEAYFGLDTWTLRLACDQLWYKYQGTSTTDRGPESMVAKFQERLEQYGLLWRKNDKPPGWRKMDPPRQRFPPVPQQGGSLLPSPPPPPPGGGTGRKHPPGAGAAEAAPLAGGKRALDDGADGKRLGVSGSDAKRQRQSGGWQPGSAAAAAAAAPASHVRDAGSSGSFWEQPLYSSAAAAQGQARVGRAVALEAMEEQRPGDRGGSGGSGGSSGGGGGSGGGSGGRGGSGGGSGGRGGAAAAADYAASGTKAPNAKYSNWHRDKGEAMLRVAKRPAKMEEGEVASLLAAGSDGITV